MRAQDRARFWFVAGFWIGLGGPAVRRTFDLVEEPAAWQLWTCLAIGCALAAGLALTRRT